MSVKPCPYEIETDDKGEKKLLINSTRFKLKMTLQSESIISRLDTAENLISDLQDNTEKKLRNPEERRRGNVLIENEKKRQTNWKYSLYNSDFQKESRIKQ